MENKNGLIMGVANDHSIAWGIAKTLYSHGANSAFTYQGRALERRVKPLVEQLGCSALFECDVEHAQDLKHLAERLAEVFPDGIDYLVHAIGFSDKNQLKGRYVDVTTRENFLKTLEISCYSFTEVIQSLVPLFNSEASLLTLTYGGASKVMPNYNVMGIAKAALETSVKYLAYDLGKDNIRVNAISAGPIRTLAGAAISNGRTMYQYHQNYAPLQRSITIEDVGSAALYLLSSLSRNVTGEVHYVDSGFNIMMMPGFAP